MNLRLDVTALDDTQARVFRYEFDGDRAQILLGRRGGVDVLLPQPKVSLVHARIERRGQTYSLTDEGSTAGTRLNGVPLRRGQRAQIKDGDRIVIADFQLVVGIAADRVDWPAESSGSIGWRMAREVLERLGPGESQPFLEVLDGPQAGVRLVLGEVGRTYVLGRAAQGDVRLDDVDLWRERAGLVREAEGVTMRDLGAEPPVLVSGERVDGSRRLRDGERITLGESRLVFRDPAEGYLRALEAPEPQAAATPAPATPPLPGPRRDTARRTPRPRRGGEWGWIFLGVTAAVAATVALVLVLAW
jgi:pSer/pThr/pTyr-binding forkhead associated (FHA) protein